MIFDMNQDYLNKVLSSKGYKALVKRRATRYGLVFLLALDVAVASFFFGLQIPFYFILTGISGLFSLILLGQFFFAFKKPKIADVSILEDVHFRIHKKKNNEKMKYHYEYALDHNGKKIWARCIDSTDSLNEQTKTAGEMVLYFRYGLDEYFCLSHK